MLCRHLIIKDEDYAFAQPSLVTYKRRKLGLRAGHTSARGRKGTASGYSLRAVRAAERELAAQAETAYRTMVAAWQPRKPTTPTKASRARAAKSAVGMAATNGARLLSPSPGNAARQG